MRALLENEILVSPRGTKVVYVGMDHDRIVVRTMTPYRKRDGTIVPGVELTGRYTEADIAQGLLTPTGLIDDPDLYNQPEPKKEERTMSEPESTPAPEATAAPDPTPAEPKAAKPKASVYDPATHTMFAVPLPKALVQRIKAAVKNADTTREAWLTAALDEALTKQGV